MSNDIFFHLRVFCQRFYHQRLRYSDAKTSGYEFVEHKSFRWFQAQPRFKDPFPLFFDIKRLEGTDEFNPVA